MKKVISVFWILIAIFEYFPAKSAEIRYDINTVIADTAECIYSTVSMPVVGSVGGEWAILALARSSADVPEGYFENYYRTVEKHIKDCKGVLHTRKHTEYSRMILALGAIGKDVRSVAGYNLLLPLGDYEKTVWQGINGAIWALIALDSGNYEIPKNPDAETYATREMYVNHILERQTSDGGWALSGDRADPDVTGMALQALAKYRDNEKVKSATERALACLSALQNESGGFSNYGTESSESSVQALVALCTLGIPEDDARFVKKGKTITDNILAYYNGKGGFYHTRGDGDGVNQMATEQCLYALASLVRARENRNPLYDMSDADISGGSDIPGLPGKNPDIVKTKVINHGKTFTDIAGHRYRTAIEALAARGIINGKSENIFQPDSTMTRAEFATIITRGLGLVQKGSCVFSDVYENDWYCSFVNTAYSYGIIKGISEREFNPGGTITREQAAVMVTRAAELCGKDTEISTFHARNILAQFPDYVKASEWASSSLAFCYENGILSDTASDINPGQHVTRAEIADMLCNMLTLCELLS